MTKAELIKALEPYPDDLPVYYHTREESEPVESVYLSDNKRFIQID